MDKPVVFLSSTIYDFRDLRSALRYYFEEKGYEVITSETNDFLPKADQHSYESCLRSIEERATHFVLLIGSRVGGWYVDGEVSITQKEYRVAYEKAKAGKLQILAFVRKEIWDVREDRKGLADLLESEEFLEKEMVNPELIPDINDTNIKDLILNHSSRILHNAKFTFDFIAEVSRVKETKDAIKNGQTSLLPPSNWIFQFNSFHDILSTLDVHFGTSIPLKRIALERNLRNELYENIAALSSKTTEGQLLHRAYLPDNYLGTFNGKAEGESTFTNEDYLLLVLHLMKGLALPLNLRSFYLQEALRSDFYLEYDQSSRAFVSSSIYNRLDELFELINKYPSTVSSISKTRDFLIEDISKLKTSGKIKVMNVFPGLLKGQVDSLRYMTDLLENIALQLISPNLSWTDLELRSRLTPFRDQEPHNSVSRTDIEQSLIERTNRMIIALNKRFESNQE